METIPRKKVSLNADLFLLLLLSISSVCCIYTFNFDSVNFNSTCTRSPKPWQRFKEKVIDKQTDYLKILLEKTLRIFVKLSRFIYTRPVCIRSDCVG